MREMLSVVVSLDFVLIIHFYFLVTFYIHITLYLFLFRERSSAVQSTTTVLCVMVATGAWAKAMAHAWG